MRVGRRPVEKPDRAPVRIIAGAVSLLDAERVINAIGRRVWPDRTSIRLIVVDDGITPGRISAQYSDAKKIYEQAVEPLVAFGLDVSVDVLSGSPKAVILETAATWRADAIMVAAGGGEHSLDKTSFGLVTEAECTVEIVR